MKSKDTMVGTICRNGFFSSVTLKRDLQTSSVPQGMLQHTRTLISLSHAEAKSTSNIRMTELTGQPERRPWHKWHFTTWLALLTVGAGLAYAQYELRGRPVMGGMWTETSFKYQGWPVTARRLEIHHMHYAPVTSSISFHSQSPVKWIPTKTLAKWIPLGLLVNILAALVLLVSTVLQFERWQRRKSPWQFSLRGLLILTTITGILLLFSQQKFQFYDWWSRVTRFAGLLPITNSLQESSWYVIAPLLLGIACLLYLVCDLILGGIGVALHKTFSSNSSHAEA